LIEAFSLEGISRANAVFDIRKNDPKYFTDPKAISINAHYLRSLPVEEIEPYVREQLEKEGIWDPDYEGPQRDWFLQTVDLIRSRFHVTTDFVTRGRAYFSEDYAIEPKAMQKNILKHEGLKAWFPILADRLETLNSFTAEETEHTIRSVADERGVKVGILTNGVRAVVTGQLAGPGLFDILVAVGRDRVVKRLRKAVDLFE
jgi:glutamyl-tRNA synthetase